MLTVLGLVCAASPGVTADGDASAALVVVALPVNANQAIREALSRLGGEATSVGFDVRFLDAGTETVSPEQLESLSHGLQPAAVVAFSGSQAGERPGHSLDVLFLDRASGATFVEHFVVEDAEAEDRAEVIVAVRAVDFIRARMLDALVRRARASGPPEPPRPVPRYQLLYASIGLNLLGTSSGFSPSLAPKIELGYEPAAWLRLSASGFGFGTRPSAESVAGKVDLDHRYLGASMTVLSPSWHRLRGALELGGGAYWMQMRGMSRASAPNTTERLWSAAMVSSVGVSWALARHLLLDVRGGALWLQQEGKIHGTELEPLGTVGRPSWFASTLLGVAY
jgi:hypothetical protein